MIINLVPHDINIVGGETYPKSGKVVRVASTIEHAGNLEGCPMSITTWGKPGMENGNRWDGELPESIPGVWYIVSKQASDACPDRWDFLVPNETVRDKDGNIMGCKSLMPSNLVRYFKEVCDGARRHA